MDVIFLGISNYYGHVFAEKLENGNYLLCLDDYSGMNSREISEEFFLAIQKEFGEKS